MVRSAQTERKADVYLYVPGGGILSSSRLTISPSVTICGDNPLRHVTLRPQLSFVLPPFRAAKLAVNIDNSNTLFYSWCTVCILHRG